MPRKRRRRTHTQHRGVKLKQIRRTGTWVARFVDPRTGGETQVSLNRLGKTNDKERRDWCIDKADEIARYRAAKLSGQPVPTRTPLEAALNQVFEAGRREWRSNTIELYERARGLFQVWCDKQGVDFSEDITAAHLGQFRSHLISQPKREPKRRGKRGQRVSNGKPRSPRSINTLINSVRALLNHLRRRDLTPNLTGEIILDRLPFMRTDRPLPKFFKIDQIKDLLEAVDKHDAELSDGLGHHRYPIRDFVHVVLLTGMRRSEALALRWEDVDFEEQMIRLPHPAGKGGIARLVTLNESPSVLRVLKARKARARDADPWVFSITRKSGRTVRYEPVSLATIESCRRRIGKDYGFRFGWHDLRRTCGSFLANAAGIYGAAGVFKTAARLGHTVQIAQQRYYGQIHVWEGAKRLEQAMDIEPPQQAIAVVETPIVINE